jgi:hypothetical protein
MPKKKEPIEKGHVLAEDAAECRRYPMIYIAADDESVGFFACPPAPSGYLCGEHVLKYNS